MNEPTTIDIQIYVRISGGPNEKLAKMEAVLRALSELAGQDLVDTYDWEPVA